MCRDYYVAVGNDEKGGKCSQIALEFVSLSLSSYPQRVCRVSSIVAAMNVLSIESFSEISRRLMTDVCETQMLK